MNILRFRSAGVSFLTALLGSLLSAFIVSAQLPNAWQINDNYSGGLGVIQYLTNLTAAQVFAATNNGWRYDLVSRMVSDSGGTASASMVFGDGTRRYYVFFDLNSTGQLTAQLLGNGTNYLYTLTSAAQGTNYHTHEMIYDPATGDATYRFDGSVIAAWAGNLSTGQSNQVMWGANSSGGLGVMNYHHAEFSITGQGVIASYDAGFDGNPATAPSPATQGWERYTFGTTIAEAAISPDSVSLPPLVTTMAASAVLPTRATFNAQLHPAGLDTGYYFEYGVTTNFGEFTPTNLVSGDIFSTNVSRPVSGLLGGATYHFRAVVTNSYITVTGADMAFTTPAYVTTQPATDLTTNAVTLNGMVNPYGLDTGYYWEYGTTTNYGSSTATNTVAADVLSTNANFGISGLSMGTTYHFRCVATNADGVAYGQDFVFTTRRLFNVTTLADSGPGSIRQAVADAQSGDFISIATNGVIHLAGGELFITHALTITGPGSANLAIDAGGNSRFFEITNGPVTLDSLTLTNGREGGTFAAGGAILLYPEIALTINRCVLSGNSVPNGNGGAIYSFGALSINDSTLSGNSAQNGGGIASEGTASAASVTLNNCTLSGNSAVDGGGIYMRQALYSATANLNNCTLVANSASSSIDGGGGIYNYLGTIVCNNCTVSGNAALNGGYAGGMLSLGTAYLTNTIMAGNSGSQGYPNAYGPITAVNSLTNGDAQLAPLGNYGGLTQTMPPLDGSPAIDAGRDSVTNFLTADQRGLPRIFGSHVDIGAAEFRPFVVVNANDSGTGSLRDIITNAPDFVTFTNALAGQTLFLTNGPLAFSLGVAIDASSLAGGMTISGNHTSRVLEINPEATVILHSLTLRDGVAPHASYPANSGGGILNLGRLTLYNCQFEDDVATNGIGPGGGGIENYAATLTASNCVFSGNAAAAGGAVKNDTGTCNLSRSTLSNNSAIETGGAIENDAATLTIGDSTLSGNAALANGGGIDNDSGGAVTVRRSTFSGNSAAAGGAVENHDGSLIGDNSTFAGDSVTGDGGGIDNQNGSRLLLDNCTIYGNSAGGVAGGLNNYGALTLTNTIVAGNSASVSANLYLDISGSFIGSHNLGSGDPLLAPLGNYGGPTQTMPPLAGSPALDAGTDSVTNFLATDQRGYPRLSGAHVDIGAVEAQYAPANNPPLLMGSTFSATGGAGGANGFQFAFSNVTNADFTVLATTNLALPLADWNVLGNIPEISSGQYQFTDPGATNYPQRFYQVVSP
jgi:Vibrio cholerae sialidase, lectin insertion